MNPAVQQADKEPETPPEVANRQKIALTTLAAEEKGTTMKEGLTQAGKGKLNAGLIAWKAANGKKNGAQKARLAAEKAAPANPLQGLTVQQIDEIRSRSYPKAPAMDSNLGDKTPAFVNFLYKKHPKDAAVRYAYRDVWPTA